MIELYRASAGSGKTYTLAKKYIWYYITITDDNGKVRLRTDAELKDSARHILAVTFTNKATNEMQMRIVDSLFKLAYQSVKTKIIDGKETICEPEYMRDFVTELNTTPERIAGVSGKALAILLENYSDFNVSTIDSFFQQVLRTFAYESEINDSYKVELDSAYLSQIGVDETLEEIDNNSKDVETPFWIKTLIERAEKGKWNIFVKSASSEGVNPYKSFIESVKKVETEQFKLNRDKVEAYFKSNVDFIKLYRDLSDKYDRPVKKAFKEMRLAFERLWKWLPDDLANASTKSYLGKFNIICRDIRNAIWNASPVAKNFPNVDPDMLSLSKIKDWIKDNPVEGAELKKKFEEAYGFYEAWIRELTSENFLHWRLYSLNLPYYALFSIVARKRQEFLDESNAIELGETSMILKDVIDGDDTPFIYEKMGTKLNHFLIDEFQDTSKMQWENLSPLIKESLSRRNGNLIIGDAKQSIYRFRNADPSIINEIVPVDYSEYVVEKGNTPAENTNYRTDLHIVKFNNSFFEFIASQIDKETSSGSGKRRKFAQLYSNVIQTPYRKEDAGYVEIRFGDKNKNEWNNEVLNSIAPLISNLIMRGYRQKDIAVLVATNTEGDNVIRSLVSYNLKKEEGRPEIRFVSEQSLKLASSRAVNIIIDVLTNMSRGENPGIREGEERRKKGVGVWADMVANFKFFQMQHPDTPVSKLLESYFKNGSDYNALSELLRKMQSFALPALVESITAAFITESLRKSDAIYIAAFQDLVIEYCESHPTDIGSFLKWWERKSLSASVSSPEDTDAVQVVTVHKSKGLEFKCVIVPFADWDMSDVIPAANKKEWLWVTPQVISHSSIPLPPVIPIETSGEIFGTLHEVELEKYFDDSKMDRLNAAYVAFTRAKKELYVFCRTKSSGERLLGKYIENFIKENINDISREGDRELLMLNPDDVEFSEEEMTVRIGRKADIVENSVSAEMSVIESYDTFDVPVSLKYRNADMPDIEVDPEDEDLNIDPRSEGNIKHSVLERVVVKSDLKHAVRHLVISGLITESMATEIEKSLNEALSNPEVKRWFDGSATVINERPVLIKDIKLRRPDRLMVYPDNHAEVVDYKFGKIDTKNKYLHQISRYVNLLRKTGNFSGVTGYLWYVNENKIIKI